MWRTQSRKWGEGDGRGHGVTEQDSTYVIDRHLVPPARCYWFATADKTLTLCFGHCVRLRQSSP